MVDLGERLGRLQAAAQVSARHAQRVQLIFVLLCAYIGVTLSAITHEVLLRDRGIELALLGLAMPIGWFCLVAPVLVILLHCQLLLQVKLLSSTLTSMDHCIIELPTAALRREQRDLLYPSMLCQVLVGGSDGGWMTVLFRAMVWVTICALPILVLTWVLLTFVPYHHVGITWFQRLALVADVSLLCVLWRQIQRTRPGRHRDLRQGTWQEYVHTATAAAGVVGACFVAFAVGVVPGESIEGFTTWPISANDWAPRHLNLAGRMLVDPAPIPTSCDAGPVAPARWRNGLDLRGRDLRQANFSGARLDNADLRAARLEGADLQRAGLRGAVFTTGLSQPQEDGEGHPGHHGSLVAPAQLQRATLRMADLDDVDLSGVALEGADLTGAYLQGALLNRTVLRGATLSAARLSGASLVRADLAGADLRGAQLQAANLTGADMRGADLAEADLRGADLHDAKLDGANLRNTRLRGADLGNASLRSACFAATDLGLSNLRGVELAPLAEEERGVLLREMILQLVGARPGDNATEMSDDEFEQFVAGFDAPWMRISTERLHAAVSRDCPPISRSEVVSTGATYDGAGLLAEWPAAPEPTTYARQLTEYLAELSCTEGPRVAKALVWQFDPARSHFGPKPALREHLRGLPAEIVRRCPANGELPYEVRLALDQTREPEPRATSVARSPRQAAPPTTVAARDRRKRGR